MDWKRYRKLAVALATAVVEIVAVWQNAPEWALAAAALAGAVLVWAVPNRPAPPPLDLPHFTADELFTMAERAQDRERAERETRP